jgi:S-DNA-T family DNA segregation ATPase FtsK/SpoIIIE
MYTGLFAVFYYLVAELNVPRNTAIILVLLVPIIWQLIRLLMLYRQHSAIPLKGIIRGLWYITKFRNLWPQAARTAKLGDSSRRKHRPPPIKSIEIANPKGTSIKVALDLGQYGNTSDDLERQAERILAVLDANSFNIQKLSPGRAAFTVNWGERPTPSLEPFMYTDENALPPFVDLDANRQGDATIDLYRSVLIGGETGSGKSNDIWVMLAELNRKGIPYKLSVIDPVGGVELDELEFAPCTRRYADRPGQADQLVREFHRDFDQRLQSMKQRSIRKHVPTPEEPFEILIIDEIIVCKEMIKGGAQSPLGDILATGRKANFVVWACTQLGQKEVITHIRDLFPQRICHRTRTEELTDCILGTHATRDGAICHRLHDPGAGYMYTDELKAFIPFRTPHIIHTRSIANGGVPLEPEPLTRKPNRFTTRYSSTNGRTSTMFVYQLFDSPIATVPVYVGISNNPNRRFKEHQADKVWFHTIIHQRSIITAYPDYQSAKEMETHLITTHNPKYNIAERRA